MRVFFNRCRHRGNLVCHRDRGNGHELRCPYHGWTYAKHGALLEPTFEEGYDDNLQPRGFQRSPRCRGSDAYRGLVFASVSPTGISLDEHLGQVKEYIDLFMDVSPTGEIDLEHGIQKLRYNGNWKFLPENSLEGDYHGPFIHRIAFELHGRRTGLELELALRERGARRDPLAARRATWSRTTAAPRWRRRQRKPTPARLAYVDMMEERYGKEKARQLLGTTPPLVYVFPNLIYIMTHIRRVQPVSRQRDLRLLPAAAVQGRAARDQRGAAARARVRLRPGRASSRPTTSRSWSATRSACRRSGNDWQFIGRGLHRDRVLPDGGIAGLHHGREPPARHVAALRRLMMKQHAMRERAGATPQ